MSSRILLETKYPLRHTKDLVTVSTLSLRKGC